MTLTVQNPAIYFDANAQDLDDYEMFAAADDSNGSKGRAAQAHVLASRQFHVDAVTTTNDTGQVLDLTDQGVTFPANTVRDIYMLHSLCNTTDRYEMLVRQSVLGGTTPRLLGRPKIIDGWGHQGATELEYGQIHGEFTIASGAVAETDVSPGMSCGDFTSGVAALAVPTHRLARLKHASLFPGTYGATVGQVLQVNPDGGAGSVRAIAPDDGAVDTNPGDGAMEIGIELWPPGNCFLSMNSNNVEVHVLGVSGDVFVHTVDVWVGRRKDRPFSTS